MMNTLGMVPERKNIIIFVLDSGVFVMIMVNLEVYH